MSVISTEEGSKIDISFWAAFGLNHGPWSTRFCQVLEAKPS